MNQSQDYLGTQCSAASQASKPCSVSRISVTDTGRFGCISLPFSFLPLSQFPGWYISKCMVQNHLGLGQIHPIGQIWSLGCQSNLGSHGFRSSQKAPKRDYFLLIILVHILVVLESPNWDWDSIVLDAVLTHWPCFCLQSVLSAGRSTKTKLEIKCKGLLVGMTQLHQKQWTFSSSAFAQRYIFLKTENILFTLRNNFRHVF